MVINCSTVPPGFGRDGRARRGPGRRYLDAPVTDGVQGAEEGALTALAAGCDEAFGSASPVLQAVELCKRLDVDAEVLFEVIRTGMASSHMFNFRAPQMLAGEFSLRNAIGVFVKDLAAVREAAEGLGIDLPVGRAARDSFPKAAEPRP